MVAGIEPTISGLLAQRLLPFQPLPLLLIDNCIFVLDNICVVIKYED